MLTAHAGSPERFWLATRPATARIIAAFIVLMAEDEQLQMLEGAEAGVRRDAKHEGPGERRDRLFIGSFRVSIAPIASGVAPVSMDSDQLR